MYVEVIDLFNFCKQIFTSWYIINQADDLACRPNTGFLITFNENAPTPYTGYEWLNFLEIRGSGSLFNLDDLLSD